MEPILLKNKDGDRITLIAITETFIDKSSDTMYHIIDSEGRIRKVLYDTISLYKVVYDAVPGNGEGFT